MSVSLRVRELSLSGDAIPHNLHFSPLPCIMALLTAEMFKVSECHFGRQKSWFTPSLCPDIPINWDRARGYPTIEKKIFIWWNIYSNEIPCKIWSDLGWIINCVMQYQADDSLHLNDTCLISEMYFLYFVWFKHVFTIGSVCFSTVLWSSRFWQSSLKMLKNCIKRQLSFGILIVKIYTYLFSYL